MSNAWTDWNQNARIDAAEAEIAAQRRARTRLAEQLREQHGTLQAQLDRLTQAFVALLEHEDIRGELAQHADAAAVRRYAREVVATLVVTGRSTVRTVAEPPDVPGYWLAAAVRGVARDTGERPDREEARRLLEEAVRRDPRRTAAFLTLLDCQTREARWSSGAHLAAVLPGAPSARAAGEVGGTVDGRGGDLVVDRVQRQVWRAVAEGRLGPDALHRLDAALDEALAALDPTQVDQALAARLDGDGPPTAEAAAGRLSRLRAILEGSDPDAVAAAEAADAEARGARRIHLLGFGADASDAARHGRDGRDGRDGQGPDDAEDPLADVLRDLVDAGSPAEGDILLRMAEARQQLGYADADRGSGDPSGSAGALLDLLLDDLTTATPEPGTGPHGVALRVLTPSIDRVARGLEVEAGVPAPSSQPVTIGREQVEVGSDGRAPGWEERARAHAASVHRTPAWRRPAAAALLVVGVVGAVLGVAVDGPYFLLALLGLVAAGGLALHDHSERRAAAEESARMVERTGRQVEETGRELAAAQQAQVAGMATASAEMQRIRALLAAPRQPVGSSVG